MKNKNQIKIKTQDLIIEVAIMRMEPNIQKIQNQL